MEHGDVRVGKGPAISRGPNINPKVYELLLSTAEKHHISYQPEAAPRGTGTDANAIQLSKGGVAAGLVSIPNRYMHSPVELVSINDLESIAKLLAEFILKLDTNTNFIP